MAVPCGWKWEPAVSERVLMRRFGVSADALLLWEEETTWSRLGLEQFVPATRSAVRATAEHLGAAA
jgi:hypothetical protein